MADNGMTQRQIGHVLGVGQKTVSRDLNFESNDSESDHKQADVESNGSHARNMRVHASHGYHCNLPCALAQRFCCLAGRAGLTHSNVRESRRAAAFCE
jgi:hypothetical protein